MSQVGEGFHYTRSLNHTYTRITAFVMLFILISVAPDIVKVREKAKFRNRYNQVPHLTQDTVDTGHCMGKCEKHK